MEEPLASPHHVNVQEVSPRREVLGVFLCLSLYVALRLVNLRQQPVNALFDEGVHLALMQMVSAGEGALYRDFLFIHPPGVIQVGAWLWGLAQGDVYGARLAYILFCSLGVLPTYAIARRLFDARIALGTLLLFAVTPGFAGWQGRTIFLEQPLNVFTLFALWLLLGASKRPWLAIVSGLLVGVGFLAKETAVAAGIASLVALAVVPRRPENASSRFLLLALFALGFLSATGAILAILARIPNYWHDTVTLNALDPYSPGSRIKEIEHGFYQLALPLTFGLGGVFGMARRERSQEERFVALYALSLGVLMVLLPKRFFWRHLLPIIPLCCLGVCIGWRRFRERTVPKPVRLVWQTFFALCALMMAVTTFLYHRFEGRVPPQHFAALAMLRNAPEPVFSLNPIWTAAAQRKLPRWRFAADAVFARQYNLATPAEFTRILRQCPTALRDKKTDTLLPPETRAVLEREYRSVFRYGAPGERDYIEIYVRTEPPAP